MNEQLEHIFDRTEIIIGKDGMDILKNSTVAVFGIGGVGSYAVEALARSGVGHIVMVDFDDIDSTNVNRQLHAFIDVAGHKKIDEMKKRVTRINPDVKITAIDAMYNADNVDLYKYDKILSEADIAGNDIVEDEKYSDKSLFDFRWDYVIDAIDMVSAKLDLIERCYQKNIPIISSMGTGNKLYPEKLQITDIYKTHTCPLAKVMRRELKNRGVKKLTVCFSDEKPVAIKQSSLSIGETDSFTEGHQQRIVGSMSFVPPVAGMICAGKVIRDLLRKVAKKE